MSAKGVQILNENGNHWFCVSSLGCPANTVNIYDSIKPKVSSSTATKVASLLHSQADTINIRVMYGQLQTRMKNCGLSAMASPLPWLAVTTHSVKVYWLPCNSRQKMAQCSLCGMWYHNACENIPDSVFHKKATCTCIYRYSPCKHLLWLS